MRRLSPNIADIIGELGISTALLEARGLKPCEEADGLVLAETGLDGRAFFLVGAAAHAWSELKAAARSDGISLFVVSAFRSVERQAEIVRQKLAGGATIEEILTVCAPPGFSEHHTGCAVDVSTPGCPALDLVFEQTPAFRWLTERAADFGFYLSFPAGNPWGYQYEPWHWRYRLIPFPDHP